jgi:hypothetical protein
VLERTAEAEVALPQRRRRTLSAEEARRRRIRNRENMRQRRQDPAFRAFEKWRREHKHENPGQDVRFEPAVSGETGPIGIRRRCSICRKRDAVEVITRLRPCAGARSGYVQMRIAYCGFC